MFLPVLTILLAVVSVTFMVVATVIFYKYIRLYRLPTEQYYLLFGFIHLRWIAWTYIGLTLLLGVWMVYMVLSNV